jgi:hypothetical protein
VSCEPRSRPELTENSSTSSVAAIENTPSLNASSRPVLLRSTTPIVAMPPDDTVALVRTWVFDAALRPVLFVIAIAAAVVTGDRTDSFWLGLLAFLVAMAAGKALRRVVRGRLAAAARAAVWPIAATGFAVLFVEVGLPEWAAALLAFVLAGVVRSMLPRERRPSWRLRIEDWGIPVGSDVIEGRWVRKEN